jgi:RNA polymerase sigma factor (sigma-70 family)
MATGKTTTRAKLSRAALKAIAGRYYLPFGCGIDHDDLVQEAAIAVAEVERRGKGNGYARRTAHNAIGMLIERERAQKRLPPEGYRTMPEGFAGAQGAFSCASVDSSSVTETTPLPPARNEAEEVVYVTEVLGALRPESREVIRLRMDPRAMLAWYKRADKPIPPVASYADIAGHLGVSVASVMRAIEEARAIVLADA